MKNRIITLLVLTAFITAPAFAASKQHMTGRPTTAAGGNPARDIKDGKPADDKGDKKKADPFTAADTNKDGALSQEEFLALPDNKDAKKAKKAFAAMDKDGDGKLSPEEFTAKKKKD